MKNITISLRDLLSNKEVRIKWRSFYTCNSILTSCHSTKCLMTGNLVCDEDEFFFLVDEDEIS
jgi:hypothetical protein